jgi:uncharacterized protein (TIGR03435 family)
MKKLLLGALSFVLLMGSGLRAQDITGNWQGTLHVGKDLRVLLKVTKDDGKLKAVMYSLDQGGQPINASSITQDGSAMKFTVELIGGTFEGKLSADGRTIAGTWTQGPSPFALILVRATPETAWEIPAPAEPPKLMGADVDPSFEVATIKPNDSGGASMQQLTINGRNFTVRNGSLGDLIAFAFGVQMKQIVGGPEWMDNDRYDVAATIEQEGMPSPTQLRTMIRKLLTDRFKLTYHKDKREMAAFVLTVGKSGQKLTPTQVKGPLPGIGFRPGHGGLTLGAQNATLTDFTGFLQTIVLDRPVVDQTGIAGRFDFTVTFTPDESEFNGHPPQLPALGDGIEAAPSLIDALAQQIGLKLSPERAAVEVIAIDHVERASAN